MAKKFKASKGFNLKGLALSTLFATASALGLATPSEAEAQQYRSPQQSTQQQNTIRTNDASAIHNNESIMDGAWNVAVRNSDRLQNMRQCPSGIALTRQVLETIQGHTRNDRTRNRINRVLEPLRQAERVDRVIRQIVAESDSYFVENWNSLLRYERRKAYHDATGSRSELQRHYNTLARNNIVRSGAYLHPLNSNVMVVPLRRNNEEAYLILDRGGAALITDPQLMDRIDNISLVMFDRSLQERVDPRRHPHCFNQPPRRRW